MTLIGSANMDRRSFELNYENNILFCDPGLTADMRQRQQFKIFGNKHTWIMSILYTMTFGSFIGFAAVFALSIKVALYGFGAAVGCPF